MLSAGGGDSASAPFRFQTPLEAQRTQVTHQRCMKQGLQLFWKYLALHHLDVACMTAGIFSASDTTARFVQWAHDSKHPFWLVKYGLLGIQTRWRHLRGHLGRGWDALRSWANTRPISNRIPLTLELLKAGVAMALSLGMNMPAHAHLFWSFSVLLRVGFCCMLRPRELISLRRSDVRFADTHDFHSATVLRIADPKNAAYLGRSQFVLLEDAHAISWLRWLVSGLPPQCRLWPSTQVKFSKVFALVFQKLGLQRLRLSPASMRAGGATFYYRAGVSVAELKFMGRWSAESTLSTYIQEAMACLVSSALSRQEADLVATVCLDSAFLWEGPPRLPWSRLFTRRRQWSQLKRTPRP